MPGLIDYYDIVSRFDAKGLREAELKSIATAERIKRLQATIGPAVNQTDDDRLIREAIRNSDRLAAEQDRLAEKSLKAQNRIVGIGRALAVAHVAARGLAAAADAIDLAKAFDAGQIDKATQAMEELKKAITGIPVVGPAGSAIGRIINTTGASPGVQPGSVTTFGIKKVRDLFAHSIGFMSDDEVAAQDEEQARLKEQQDRTQKVIDFRRKAVADAEALLESLKQEEELEGKTAQQRKAILLHRRLDDFDTQTLNMRTQDQQAAFSPERRAARRELLALTRAADRAAQDEQDQAEREAEDAARRMVDEYWSAMEDEVEERADDAKAALDKLVEGHRRATQLEGETDENNLRAAGKSGEANVHRIERELRAALENAGDDQELRQAFIDNANSQLDALIAVSGRRVAGGTSAFDAGQTDFGRGSDAKEMNQHLRDLVKEAQKNNAILKDLTATTS